jgi:hypothetical protein
MPSRSELIAEIASDVAKYGRAICAFRSEFGKKPFQAAYREAKKKFLVEDCDPGALRIYATIYKYIEEKRRLALVLLESEIFVHSDNELLHICRSVLENKPIDADHIINPLLEDEGDDYSRYNMGWSYLEDEKLHSMSWDGFLGNHSLDYVMEGHIEARCLVSAVSLPDSFKSILDEIRINYAFGNLTSVHSLCRTLLETGLTDLCLRLGFISCDDLHDAFFFKQYPPKERIFKTCRGPDRDEAFRIYKIASESIHGVSKKDDGMSLIRATIHLLEKLYAQHAQKLK